MELSPRSSSSYQLSQATTASPLNVSLRNDDELMNNQDLHHEMKQLFNFSLKGNVEKVREILREYKELINCKDKDGRTPLYLAASRGKRNVVQLLVEEFNADKEATSDLGGTAFWAACKGGHPEVVQYLANKGANIHVQGQNRGDSLLHSPITIARSSNTPGGNAVTKLLPELYRRENSNSNSNTVEKDTDDDTVTLNPVAFDLEGDDQEDLVRRKRQRNEGTDVSDRTSELLESMNKDLAKYKEENDRLQQSTTHLLEAKVKLQLELDGAKGDITKLIDENKSLHQKNSSLEEELHRAKLELQGVNAATLPLEDLNTLKEELRQYKAKVKNAIRESKNCIVCFENTKNAMFLPCKHFHCCQNCAATVMRSSKQCPYCKQDAKDFTLVKF